MAPPRAGKGEAMKLYEIYDVIAMPIKLKDDNATATLGRFDWRTGVPEFFNDFDVSLVMSGEEGLTIYVDAEPADFCVVVPDEFVGCSVESLPEDIQRDIYVNLLSVVAPSDALLYMSEYIDTLENIIRIKYEYTK